MSYRMLVLFVGALLCAGCQKTAPPSSPAAASSSSPAASPAATPTTADSDSSAPVATLLGKPVYRHDCLSSGGIGSAEVGFQRLIVMALMDDFCQAQSLTLSRKEIDSFWETWESAARRLNNKLPETPAFDKTKIQTQLDEVRGKLATANVPWLERLTLQSQERGHLFALEHESVAAVEAYTHLMPLHCQKAMYEKYGGKVVGMQISIEPIGAYLKLIEEAEASGQLTFHDAPLEQSFRKRMNDYASRQEVPPEFVDFSLPMWLQITLQRSADSNASTAGQPSVQSRNSGEQNAAVPKNNLDMLSRFVGVWQTRGTDKPSKWKPEGGESNVHEVTQWALQNRIILGREHNQTNRTKQLWVMTYDQQQNAYPFWMFDSNGLMGGQWQLTWDAATQTATGHATDTPAGWISHGTNQFPDATTNNVHFWMKDETGTLLMEANAAKRRQPDETGAAYLAAWSKSDPIDNLPAELRVLDRMIGEWDTVTVQKQAEWMPAGGRSTATVTREWILNGRFVMDTSQHSNGDESITILGYDSGQKTYRSWWFNSRGHRNDSRGQWNEASQTLSHRAELEDGKTSHSSVRFANADTEVWQFKVTDADGKAYLDMDITATRRAAEPAAEGAASNIKQTDRERLQGTWGLVSIVQDGKAADEKPIAPEVSAIKYVFQDDRFTLLASGNAGATPQGTLKFSSSQ